MRNFLILGSGIALGVFVPALSLKHQLEQRGDRATVFCLESLYRDKKSVTEETRRSFHRDFRLARASYRFPVRNRTVIDPQREEAFLADLREHRYDAVITFSGFFSEVLNRLRTECPYYEGRLYAVHMDAGYSLSWKGAERSGLKEIWLYRLEGKEILLCPEPPLSKTVTQNRILVHGGGWGIGDYQDKIRRLNELGFPLDIIIYYPEEAEAVDPCNTCYLLDPSWSASDHPDEYPPLLKQEGKEWKPWGDSSPDNPLRKLIEADIAILSKPGGGTIADSLATGTPLIFAEELASYEKTNRDLWEQLGFGIGFDAFVSADDFPGILKGMRQRLHDAAAGLPVLADAFSLQNAEGRVDHG